MNWCISLLCNRRDGFIISNPTISQDKCYIKGNNKIDDEVICYDDQWSISEIFKHSDATRPLVVTSQNTQISNLALLLLQGTRVNTPTYKLKVRKEATEDSLCKVMTDFIYAMKIAFELHNNNKKSHPILKDCKKLEELEDFV